MPTVGERRVVCDASALVALLVDAGRDGRWATQQLTAARLLAPDLALFEAANVLRRTTMADQLDQAQAAQAHADLLALPIELWPYEPLAPRAWELRANLSTYDASYVALAELQDAPLVTLDRRITGAPGLRCRVLTPPFTDS